MLSLTEILYAKATGRNTLFRDNYIMSTEAERIVKIKKSNSDHHWPLFITVAIQCTRIKLRKWFLFVSKCVHLFYFSDSLTTFKILL